MDNLLSDHLTISEALKTPTAKKEKLTDYKLRAMLKAKKIKNAKVFTTFDYKTGIPKNTKKQNFILREEDLRNALRKN